MKLPWLICVSRSKASDKRGKRAGKRSRLVKFLRKLSGRGSRVGNDLGRQEAVTGTWFKRFISKKPVGAGRLSFCCPKGRTPSWRAEDQTKYEILELFFRFWLQEILFLLKIKQHKILCLAFYIFVECILRRIFEYENERFLPFLRYSRGNKSTVHFSLKLVEISDFHDRSWLND